MALSLKFRFYRRLRKVRIALRMFRAYYVKRPACWVLRHKKQLCSDWSRGYWWCTRCHKHLGTAYLSEVSRNGVVVRAGWTHPDLKKE